MKDLSHVAAAGGLLSRDLLNRVSATDPTLAGTKPTDYNLVPGERTGDAVARSWNRLVGVWANFRQAETRLPDGDRTATTLTRRRWIKPLLEELDFHGLHRVNALPVDDTDYPISHQWETSVPIHQLGWRVAIDSRTKGVRGAAKKSPHSLMQEFLNRSPQHLWGIVTNGRVMRVLRDNASLTRKAYCEFDLEAIFDGNAYSDFQILWRICHRSRFEGAPPADCLLEKWNIEAITSGTRALDQLRQGVEKALEELGTGFLTNRANTQLQQDIRGGALTADELLRQLLRLVYRMLFLLVAENRRLLLSPDAARAARDRYHGYYSMGRLRRLAARRRGTAHTDLWKSLQVTMGALDGKTGGIPELGLSPLGSFLWSPDSMAALNTAVIDNRHFLAAVRSLCYTHDPQAKARRPVDYKNLGSEELGSVYESLLELHADINGDARTFRLATAAGSERKITGSYYTPTPLIERLLDEALDPLLDRAETTQNPEQALLGLRVLDPATGSGHFLIAAAHRIAGRLAGVRADGDEPTPDQLRTALRDVIGQCLYGIDNNPMAVELCKVSLWLEGNHHGQPLSFLDHHIVCGNSLLGTTPELLDDGIPQAAFKKLSGDDPKRVAQLRKTNLAERKQRNQQILALDWDTQEDLKTMVVALSEVNATSDRTIAGVAAKADSYERLLASEEHVRLKLAADAWCAAFVIAKTPDRPPITDATVRAILAGHNIPPDTRTAIEELADEYQFLHPHLMFPDVYNQGGFDLVIGNPPWDQIQYDPRETFAITHPHIAAASTMAVRNRQIGLLAHAEPEVHVRYLLDRHRLDGVKHYIHASGRYPLSSVGRLNTAPLFVELMWAATNWKGRVGVIVPTGFATHSFKQGLFRAMVDQQALVSLYDFENRKALFPNVHRSYKFCLLTLAGREAPVSEAGFVFFAQEITDLDQPRRRYTLTPDDFALFNPNTRTTPTFRRRRDAEITKGVYERLPVLVEKGAQGGNPWGVEFQLMFMMNTDSRLFRTRQSLEREGWTLQGNHFLRDNDRYLPLYEGKMVGLYDHRAADVVKSAKARHRQNQPRYLSSYDKARPDRVVLPLYWVPEEAVKSRNRHSRNWLSSFNDFTSATNRRTMVCSAIPMSAVPQTQRLFYSQESEYLLLAVFGSFAFDYISRQKVGGTHFTFEYLRQMPVPTPESMYPFDCLVRKWILELGYTAWDMSAFAEDLGYHGPPFLWDDRRRHLIHSELDALMFRVYGLPRHDVVYIMETFTGIRNSERRTWGEYRTKRLVLERYDAMAVAARTGLAYETVLDPPPAHRSVAHDESTRPDWLRPASP